MLSAQASINGTSRLYEPVISLTITIEVNGVFDTPAKNPPIPTRTNAAGSMWALGSHCSRELAASPPSIPPMNIDGPNTPPLPPELMVSPVATIFSKASVKRTLTPMCGTKLCSPGVT